MDRNMVQQTYLAGGDVTLRAVDENDAACEPSWRQSWFPRARSVAEAKIEEEQTGDDITLVAERNRDGVIVGSAAIWFDASWVHCQPFAARWLPDDQADAVIAEIVELALPFLVDEGGMIAAQTTIASGLPRAMEVLERIGARRCYRYREAKLWRGERRDWLAYQYFNGKTLAVFGEPLISPEGPVIRQVASPAPGRFPIIDTPPTGAVMVGERVYLRMFTPDDGPIMRDASLSETESAHDPRFPRSALELNARFRKESESEMPSQISFAIVQLDNDELIGRTELDFLDLVHRSAETGSELFRPEYRNKGYGTEAKHLLLSYAFDVLNLHMVWSIVWEENPRSRAALLKQGYRVAGSTPWRGLHHGIPSGDWHFDLLASEWKAARR